MAHIFYRQYQPAFWDLSVLEGPVEKLSLREWETAVILCSQDARIDKALRRWLEAPTDHDLWPWPGALPKPRPRLGGSESGTPLEKVLEMFHDEIKAIRLTLDYPLEAFSGISRNALLAMHGQRLRWLVWRLGLKRTLQEIAQFVPPRKRR